VRATGSRPAQNEGSRNVTEPDDVARFAAIYDENRSRVYAYAVSKAGRQLADEIVSEVFLVAWRRFADLPEPPLPWLLVAARNVAASQFRAVVREQSVAAEMRAWTSQAELTAGDIAEQVADRIAVLTALASLPEPDRELLTLVAWHGLSASSAARVVGCSTAAYFVRLHRARRRLELAVAAVTAEPGQVDRHLPAGQLDPAPDRPRPADCPPMAMAPRSERFR
jgi:RNA polymerase sigma-70 factor, ECF subfamily